MVIFGEWCKYRTEDFILDYGCSCDSYNGYCSRYSCPILKKLLEENMKNSCSNCKKKDIKIKQIKKSDFKKAIGFTATCPNCSKPIKYMENPEINDRVTCTNCYEHYEICSTNNYNGRT